MDNLEKEVQAELIRLFKKEPVKVIQFLLLLLCEQCVESNAGTANFIQEATAKGKRYKIYAKCSIEEIKVKKSKRASA